VVASSLVEFAGGALFGVERPGARTEIVEVAAGSPGARAGLAAHDTLVSIAGVAITGGMPQVRQVVRGQGDRGFTVVVERGGERRAVELQLEDGRMGLYLDNRPEVVHDLGIAATEAIAWPAAFVRDWWHGVAQAVRESREPTFAGPVALTQAARRAPSPARAWSRTLAIVLVNFALPSAAASLLLLPSWRRKRRGA
jgi:membrane-associated protease RseP (regulator of RpoE activity)